jgi:glutathione S-transferase
LFPLALPIFRAYLGADRRRLARARDRLDAHFDRLEAEIGPSGYLVGDRFGVADLCAASVMTAILRPPEFPYPLPDPWPPALTELRAGFSERKGFRWVLDMYARHRSPSSEIAG